MAAMQPEEEWSHLWYPISDTWGLFIVASLFLYLKMSYDKAK